MGSGLHFGHWSSFTVSRLCGFDDKVRSWMWCDAVADLWLLTSFNLFFSILVITAEYTKINKPLIHSTDNLMSTYWSPDSKFVIGDPMVSKTDEVPAPMELAV